jgi:N-acyl-D-aspartate/D-glutamate deacylase
LSQVVGDLVVADTHDDATSRYAGLRLADVATLHGGDAYDALFDLWAADGAQTGFFAEPLADSTESWEVRHENWSDPRVVIGASDAGAHVQVLSTFDYTVALLALARESGAMTLPAAIHQLTEVPARLYGLEGRGRIAVGAAADLVVLDPETVGPGAPSWRDDLPAGRGRIYREPNGISSVVVNGVEIVNRHGLTGDRPGQVLRRAVPAGA